MGSPYRSNRRKMNLGTMAAIFIACVTAPALAQFETRGTRSIPSESVGFAAGDFDNSGNLDLAVVSNGLSIALGNGDGTFHAPTTYPYLLGGAIAVGDFDGDGNLDLVATAYPYSSEVEVFLGNGDGTFQAPISAATTEFPSLVAVGDFNGDGKLDVVIIDHPYISVLLGNGDGTFQTPIDNDSFIEPEDLSVGDFNNDNRLDVMVVGSYGSVSNVGVLLGNGDGTLQSSLTYPLFYTANSVAVGDFNRDGNLDTAIEGKGLDVTVLLGDGEGGFGRPEYYELQSGYGQIAVGDFNGNGLLDLAAAGFSDPAGLSILAGNGDGTFQAAQFYPAGVLVQSLAVGDFNGDDKPDVELLDRDHGAITLLNTGVASFSPTTPLIFKKQDVGTTSAPQDVTLTNTGKTVLKLSSMKASSQFGVTSNCSKSVRAGAKCTIIVTFSPKSQGTKTGTVTIIDSASSKPQVIALSGTGT